MSSREERLQEYLRVSALLPQATEELMRYPGVRDVAVGLKETGDRATEEIVFRVYVDEKKAPDQLAPGERIPDQVLGVATDVNLEPTPRLADDTSKYRPLEGGIQIGNDTSTALGTLGCFAQRNGGDRSIVALSCHHVMMDGGAAVGEKIGQPEISCCCCCKGNIVGEVVDARNDTLVDCAIARITGSPGFTAEIEEIGWVMGSAPLIPGPTPSTVAPGDRVRKRGRTTGLTSGTVLTPSKFMGGKNQQIEIKPDPGFERFAYKGDSGSVVVDEHNVVVGLLWSIDAATEKLGYANFITNVMSAMDITILVAGTPGTIPLGAGAVADAEAGAPAGIAAEAAELPLERVRRALEPTARGRAILALFDLHGHEINRLLNNDRPVKAAWNRYQGPAFTAHLLKSAREPEHRIPSEIEGVTPANLLIRMSVVLQERGSPALAAAVEENTLPLLELAARGDRVHELLARAGEPEPETSESPYALAV